MNQEETTIDLFTPLFLQPEDSGNLDPEKHIVIGDKAYLRTPDPDRARRLTQPDKPIVTYCNTRYYLINSAKLQMVNDLTCIVGIPQRTGKDLLEQFHNSKKEAGND